MVSSIVVLKLIISPTVVNVFLQINFDISFYVRYRSEEISKKKYKIIRVFRLVPLKVQSVKPVFLAVINCFPRKSDKLSATNI